MLSGEIFLEHTISTTATVTAVVLAVVMGGLAFWRYLPRNRATIAIIVLRLLFIALCAWCLFMPSLKRALTEYLKPRFLVAVDTSESMTMTPTNDIPSRWAVACEVLGQPWAQILTSQCIIDYFPVSSDLGNKLSLEDITGATPDGKSTCLQTSLRKLMDRYRGQPVCGLLLLSDGIDTREANDAWASKDWPYPIYTVRPEAPDIWKAEPDVRVDSVDTPRRVVVDWDTELKASVSGQGTGGKVIEVRLYKDEELLESVPIEIQDDGGSRATTFRLTHPATGNFIYSVKIPPIPGETHTNDNSFSVTVQVIDSKNRLLYVESVPRWESKYLIRALKVNQSITPTCFVRGPEGHFLTYGTASKVSPEMNEDQLLKFKIVILGDLDAAELGDERTKSLVKFVENGGSLVLLGGVKAWGTNGYANGPLGGILPFRGQLSLEEGEFKVGLTPEGQLHPAFQSDDKTDWENLPPVLSIFPAASLTPGASTLVTTLEKTGARPFVIVQSYGQGKVLAILTDSLWRWQLSGSKKNPYQRFWNQILVWLTPSEEELEPMKLDLFGDAERLCLGDTIDLNSRLGGYEDVPQKALSVTCNVQCPDKRQIPFVMTAKNVTSSTGKTYPGFAFTFTPRDHGLHTAVAVAEINGKKVSSDPYSFFVKPFTPETNPRAANIYVLKNLADASKGEFCEVDRVNDVLSSITVKTGEEERIDYTSLWNNIPVIACLIAFLALEWVIRKAGNLA